MLLQSNIQWTQRKFLECKIGTRRKNSVECVEDKTEEISRKQNKKTKKQKIGEKR